MAEQEQKTTATEAEEKEFKPIANMANAINKYAKENPKNTYKILIGITALSLLMTLVNFIYIQKVEKPKYEQLSKKTKVVDHATSSIANPINATKKVLDIQEALKELEYFKNKKELTKEDTLRIEYLIDKYHLRDEEN